MLTSNDYQNAEIVKAKLHRSHFVDSKKSAFRKLVCETLDSVYGYHHIVFGYLNKAPAKSFSLDIMLHHVPTEFVERFFRSNILQDPFFLKNDDCVKFSDISKYKQKRIYRELLLNFGYSDFLVCFLPIDKEYQGYLLIFHDKAQKEFSAKDLEILSSLREYIAVEYYNILKIMELSSTSNTLLSQLRHLPVGVIVLQNRLNVTYTNELAKTYLSELGISSPEFFNVFYSNHIVPNIKNNMIRNPFSQIIRYKNYLFSIIGTESISPEVFASSRKETPPMDTHYGSSIPSVSITTYIYIMKDEYSSYSKSKTFFSEYSLTDREQEIAELLITGYDVSRVSDELGISTNTVKVHIRNIYRKCQVNSRSEFIFKMMGNPSH